MSESTKAEDDGVTSRDPSGSSSKKDPTPSSKKPREKKHGLQLPGLPPLGLNAPASLVGTPYASSHAPPFEYPFPSPSSTATPTIYFPALDFPSHPPFPYAQALLHRVQGQSYPFGQVKVNSLGLGFPWHRSDQPHPKFLPPVADPPVPPRLKEKVGEKAASSVSKGETMKPRLARKDAQARVLDPGDEPGVAFDQSGSQDKDHKDEENPDIG
ncbi:hypothetical protein K439DRAFT_1629118 [Ramaria rubella]|nr:hypothetical protein K439DRAFT_1629118 [Ramaria rubella]